MNREQYIQLRTDNHLGNVILHFYMECCKEQNVFPLPADQFLRAFNMWEHSAEVMDLVVHHYDTKLEIFELSHKGVVIKYF